MRSNVNEILLYVGSSIITLWGVAHIIPVKPVVSGFGPISEDNKRIITMEWVAEGLTLCFVGLLVFLITISAGAQNAVSVSVYRLSAGMLIVLAGLSLMTGARTAIVPMRLCPVVKTVAAVLFLIGSTQQITGGI